jgi:hypothetical protein
VPKDGRRVYFNLFYETPKLFEENERYFSSSYLVHSMEAVSTFYSGEFARSCLDFMSLVEGTKKFHFL